VVLVSAPATLAPGGVDAASMLAIAWLALVAAAGQALAVASLRRLPAARTAAFLLLNPITATILSAVLLGQVPTMTQLLGGALVLVGIAAATL
jgi:drug/metabolite transporter (DMT)-like permease